MKQLQRIILNALTLLSLVLCVATVGMWVRSYVYWDTAFVERRLNFLGLESAKGDLALRWDTDSSDAVANYWRPGRRFYVHTEGSAYIVSLSGACRHNALGLGCDTYDRLHAIAAHGNDTVSTRERQFVLPYWLVVLILATAPLIAIVRRVRCRSKNRAGLCPVCNYDLRATPDRCPECGTIPANTNR